MKYKKQLRHAILIMISMTAAHLHAATIDYTLKYNTWELISIPYPLPFAVNTPMKLFGGQIADELPQAEYGELGDWVMYSYNSSGAGDYEVADKDTVFVSSKGYWVIQAASMDDISVQVVTRYNVGDRGPGGGIVFFVDPDTGGTTGLEAAPADQGNSRWCASGGGDIDGVVNITSKDIPDPNSGAHNTALIIANAVCVATSAAGVAAAYEWPEGQTDGFLPNKDELNMLLSQRDVVGGFAIFANYWSSSESVDSTAWLQVFDDSTQLTLFKGFTVRVRAIRAF